MSDTIDLATLSSLREIFATLLHGRHISAEDGVEYYSLRDHAHDYTRLFLALGFDLVVDPRGFAYFRSENDAGKEMAACALFLFIFLQHWDDQGKELQTELFNPNGFRLSELPHFKKASWSELLEQVKVTTAEQLREVCKQMARLGFLTRLDDETYRFRKPVFRFLDVCLELLDENTKVHDNSTTED